MTPTQLRNWQDRLGLTDAEAADAIGLSLSTYANYKSGRRRGTNEKAPIPKAVSLACAAVALGIRNYPG